MGRVLLWQPILWIEFPCNQWEVVSWSRRLPPFLFFEGARFLFSSCVWCEEWTVHCLLFTWTVGSWLSMQAFVFFFLQWGVSMKFPRGSPSSQCVPQYVSKSTTLLSPVLCPKVLPFLTYIARPMGRHSILQQQTFLNFGQPPKFQVFSSVMGQSKWLFATKKTKNLRTPFIYLNKKGSLFVLFVMLRSPKPWCIFVLLESC